MKYINICNKTHIRNRHNYIFCNQYKFKRQGNKWRYISLISLIKIIWLKYTLWSNDKTYIISSKTEKYIYLVSIPAAFSSGQVPAVSFKTVYVNIWSGSCESMLLLVVSLSSMTTFSFMFATSDANNKNYTWSSRSIRLFIFIYKIKHHLIPSIVHQLVICRKVGIFNFIREK